MKPTPRQIPVRTKRIIQAAGLLLAFPGLFIAVGYFCFVVTLAVSGDSATGFGILSFSAAFLTLGAGGLAFRHASASLKEKPSRPLRLPPVWALIGIFGLCVAFGVFISESDVVSGLLFPPILWMAAGLPPLWAVAWFSQPRAAGLTWRRGLVALAGGATISVAIAILLEVLFPIVILSLISDLAGAVMDSVETIFAALAGENIASAVTNPGFIYIFIQIAIIAPVVEELAKPLITLPLIGHLSRRDAFLVGALAGAGFALVENVLYASFGFYFWAGIIVVRALGGALHPLGAGLVALGWRGILRGEKNAWSKWLIRFGIAVGAHALWNGGSLLVITLAGAQFFGKLPPELDVLGLTAAGTTLALLVILGLAALWAGRSLGERFELSPIQDEVLTNNDVALSDRAVAIWALAILVALVPAGIAGLQLLLK